MQFTILSPFRVEVNKKTGNQYEIHLIYKLHHEYLQNI